MGGYLLWHPIADVTANILGALDEEQSDLYRPSYNNRYQQRTADLDRDHTPHFQLWTGSVFVAADPSTWTAQIGMSLATAPSGWEPWSAHNEGTFRPSYVNGNITDPNNLPLPLTSVSLFLTSTGALVSSGITDNNGNYSLPTPYSGQAHFVYANWGANAYTGGTSNALTPNA